LGSDSRLSTCGYYSKKASGIVKAAEPRSSSGVSNTHLSVLIVANRTRRQVADSSSFALGVEGTDHSSNSGGCSTYTRKRIEALSIAAIFCRTTSSASTSERRGSLDDSIILAYEVVWIVTDVSWTTSQGSLSAKEFRSAVRQAEVSIWIVADSVHTNSIGCDTELQVINAGVEIRVETGGSNQGIGATLIGGQFTFDIPTLNPRLSGDSGDKAKE